MRPPSRSSKQPLSLNSSLSSPATIFTLSTTIPNSLDSTFSKLDRNNYENRNFSEPDGHSNTSAADHTTTELSTCSAYPPSPPHTPERTLTKLKPRSQTSASSLINSPRSLKSSPSQPLPEEDIQITEYPTQHFTVEAKRFKSIASDTASDTPSPKSSFTSSTQNEPEEVPSSGSTSFISRLFSLFKFSILAPKRGSRAQARDSRIQNVFKLIKQIHEGTYSGTQSIIRRTLSPSEYQDLLVRIETDEALEGFFHEKLRFEYSYTHRQFTIDMTSGIHGVFMSRLEHKIQGWLEDLASSSTDKSIVATIARNILPLRDTRIAPPDPKYGGKGPDASFKFRRCKYPELVIEVAWSQSKLNLEEKARYYLANFEEQVQTVICFNFHDIYKEQQAAQRKWSKDEKKRKDKKEGPSSSKPLTFLAPTAAASSASFTVRHTKKDNVHDQVFQSAYQQYDPEVSLVISLKDFVSDATVRKLCTEGAELQEIEYPQLEVSSEVLCGWFEDAVDDHRSRWEQDLERAENLRKEKQNAKGSGLRKEVATLGEGEVLGTTGGRRFAFQKAMERILRPRSRRQPEEV